jgi:hypothetical protein
MNSLTLRHANTVPGILTNAGENAATRGGISEPRNAALITFRKYMKAFMLEYRSWGDEAPLGNQNVEQIAVGVADKWGDLWGVCRTSSAAWPQ